MIYTLLNFLSFCICRTVKLPAVTKAIATVTKAVTPSSRQSGRSAKVTQARETVVKQEQVPESEHHEIHDKKLVVDLETLSFRPPVGQRLQTARRGKKFIPGNVARCWTGRVSAKGDEVNEIDASPYNELLAAQILVHLSEDQPKEGDICKLHADSKLKQKSGDKNYDHLKGDDFTNEENVMAGKSEVELKDNSSDKKQDNVKGHFTNQENVSVTKDDSEEKKNETEKGICKTVAQVQKPVPLKRQKYVKGKMVLKHHPFMKTKSNKMLKLKPKFKSSIKKEISEKKEKRKKWKI